MKRLAASLTFAMAVLLTLSESRAQGLEEVKAHYTKYEYRIPMRDGVQALHRRLRPQGRRRSPTRSCSRRTPYSVGPYGVDQYKTDLGPSPLFGKEGYIFVYQDVRGRWMSEGEFVDMRPAERRQDGRRIDESSDTYDTIDWLVKHVAEQQRQGRACGASRTPASTRRPA